MALHQRSLRKRAAEHSFLNEDTGGNRVLVFYPETNSYSILPTPTSKKLLKKKVSVGDIVKLGLNNQEYEATIWCIGNYRECEKQERVLENVIQEEFEESLAGNSADESSHPYGRYSHILYDITSVVKPKRTRNCIRETEPPLNESKIENEEELAKFQTSSMGLEQNGFQGDISSRSDIEPQNLETKIEHDEEEIPRIEDHHFPSFTFAMNNENSIDFENLIVQRKVNYLLQEVTKLLEKRAANGNPMETQTNFMDNCALELFDGERKRTDQLLQKAFKLNNIGCHMEQTNSTPNHGEKRRQLAEAAEKRQVAAKQRGIRRKLTED